MALLATVPGVGGGHSSQGPAAVASSLEIAVSFRNEFRLDAPSRPGSVRREAPPRRRCGRGNAGRCSPLARRRRPMASRDGTRGTSAHGIALSRPRTRTDPRPAARRPAARPPGCPVTLAGSLGGSGPRVAEKASSVDLFPQQPERPGDDRGWIAVGDLTTHQVLQAPQIVVSRLVQRHLQFVAVRRKRGHDGSLRGRHWSGRRCAGLAAPPRAADRRRAAVLDWTDPDSAPIHRPPGIAAATDTVGSLRIEERHPATGTSGRAAPRSRAATCEWRRPGAPDGLRPAGAAQAGERPSGASGLRRASPGSPGTAALRVLPPSGCRPRAPNSAGHAGSTKERPEALGEVQVPGLQLGEVHDERRRRGALGARDVGNAGDQFVVREVLRVGHQHGRLISSRIDKMGPIEATSAK